MLNKNISKNHALSLGNQGEHDIYCAKKNPPWDSGEKNEDDADSLAGRHDCRLRHAKEASKLVRGMYLTM